MSRLPLPECLRAGKLRFFFTAHKKQRCLFREKVPVVCPTCHCQHNKAKRLDVPAKFFSHHQRGDVAFPFKVTVRVGHCLPVLPAPACLPAACLEAGQTGTQVSEYKNLNKYEWNNCSGSFNEEKCEMHVQKYNKRQKNRQNTCMRMQKATVQNAHACPTVPPPVPSH